MLNFKKDTLIISIEDEGKILVFYDVWCDEKGNQEKSLYTQFEVSRLNAIELEEAINAIGTAVLANFDETREILSRGEILTEERKQELELSCRSINNYELKAYLRDENAGLSEFYLSIEQPKLDLKTYDCYCNLYCPLLLGENPLAIRGVDGYQAYELSISLICQLLENNEIISLDGQIINLKQLLIDTNK